MNDQSELLKKIERNTKNRIGVKFLLVSLAIIVCFWILIAVVIFAVG